MWLLFLPILFLLVLMVSGLLAGVFWLVGSFWPVLLIGLGAWLFWHEDGRHYRGKRMRAAFGGPRSPRHAPRQQPSNVDKHAPSPTAERPELPIDVQVKVEQIRRKVDVLLGFADRFPPFSQDLYLVRQTASDYLPRTVDTFLGMPKETVDAPLHPGGKTAREELKAQLDLLDSKLDDIAQDLQRQDADRLLANRRFLESRFSNRGGDLDKDSVA
jgi:hypothetical protein